MSESPLVALIEPSLNVEEDRTAVLALYAEQLLSLNRPAAYAFLLDRRTALLAAMRTQLARCEFVLRGWRHAPAVDWGRWSDELQLAEPEQAQVCDLALDVVVHVLEVSAHLTTVEAIAAAAARLRPLAPALGKVLDQSSRTRLGNAAEEALEAEWADSEEEMNLQVARHELIRGIEEIVPSAHEELAEQRSNDAVWPLDNEVEVDPVVLRGWRLISRGLDDETYERIIDAIPAFDHETQPQRFAEAMTTGCVLRSEGAYAGGRGFVKARLDEMGALEKTEGDYRDPIRTAAAACADLSPTSIQLRRLLAYVGPEPEEETRESVRRWTAAHGRGPTATLIKDVMRFPMAGWWMATFRECEYDEAPILRRLEEVMFEDDNKVRDRIQFAGSLQALGLRTKTGPNRVAKAIVKLLRTTRKHHHRNDLPVALILCSAIGSQAHNQHTQIGKALVAYAKKWNHRFNAAESEAILEAGVSLPQEHLNTKARKGLQETAEEVAAQAGKWVISRLSPFS